ncbi:MAG: hypothetical protein IPH88_09800 [Bacteroidales bacterium]|nr:hypothetical protein [Bacteroidales bacterium]
MKKFFVFATLLLLASSLFAQSSDFPDVIIKKKKFMINDVSVGADWSVTDVIGTLGNNARVRAGYNITHTYDDLGIVVFEKALDKKGSGMINEIQFHFIPIVNEVAPKWGFRSEIKIDKLTVRKDLDKATVLKKLSKWKQTDSYLEHSIRLDNGMYYIYFQFSDDESQLQKISIGKNTK